MRVKPKNRRGGRKPNVWKLLTVEQLKKFREEHRVSRNRLATLLGVSSTSVQNWETGLARPGQKYQVKLVEILANPGTVSRLDLRQPVGPVMHAVQEAELQATGQVVIGWMTANPKAKLDELSGVVRAVRQAFRT